MVSKAFYIVVPGLEVHQVFSTLFSRQNQYFSPAPHPGFGCCCYCVNFLSSFILLFDSIFS
jgi:hypothetical protein